jgi:hypothetical protein
MLQFSNYLLIGALVCVGLILLAGFQNLFQGDDPEKSQRLMRWRVGAQLLAILIIVVILLFRH